MCGPMQGAVAGAIVFEGWARNLKAAEKLAASGGIAFHPNHKYGAVGPYDRHHHALDAGDGLREPGLREPPATAW
jgi:hypothetical protein